MRLLLLLALLVCATACERSREPAPRVAPPAANAPATPATATRPAVVAEPSSATTSPPPSTVNLPPPPTISASPPTAQPGPKRPAPAAPSRVAAPPAEEEWLPQPEPAVTLDPEQVQALREFESEQQRRDRELLEQDVEEAELRQREEAWARERAQFARGEGDRVYADEGLDDRAGDPAYDLPPEDEWRADELPLDDEPYPEQEFEDDYVPEPDRYRP